MRKQILHSVLCIANLFFFSCANQVAPTGGEKDVKPPHVSKSSPENLSTSFRGHDFNISFDEFIQLKDITKQLVVSPPLKSSPTTLIKGKTLFVHFDDTLRENTTYTVNFGNSVADITEGNAIENFQYVFSTGASIDSLRVTGKVEFAFNKKTEKGINVMLYQSQSDSASMKELPSYFAKTNESGEFSINNVADGNYQLVGLKDENSNYFFDNVSEAVSVSDNVQANQTGVLLRLFKEKSKQQLLKSFCEEAGKAVIIYSRPLENPSVTFLGDTSALKIFSIFYSDKKDSVIIWYRNRQSDSLNMIVNSKSGSDTLSIRLKHFDEKAKQLSGRGVMFESGGEIIAEPNRATEIFLGKPIDKFDFSKIIFTEDSVLNTSATFSFADKMQTKLKIDFLQKENKKYSLLIPPATFTNIFGNTNDTLKYIIKTKLLTDYGTLTLKLKLPSEGKNYLVQMVDESENVFLQRSAKGDTTLHYTFLNPKSYRLKIVEDANNNGEWDTGIFLEHIQPEYVFYYSESVTIRANWDVDVSWKPEVGKIKSAF
jgi:hypothetical protein